MRTRSRAYRARGSCTSLNDELGETWVSHYGKHQKESTRGLVAQGMENHPTVQGIGEIWANFPPWGCQERIEIVRNVLTPLLVGEELDDPRRLYALMHRRLRLLANQWGAPGPVHQAVAGLDIAIWDAHARSLGVSARQRDDGQVGEPARPAAAIAHFAR